MSHLEILQIGRDLMLTSMLLALPAVLVSLIVGLLVSIFQTVTSIQEQTLSFAPRIAAVAVVLILTLPWMLKTVVSFASRMFLHAAEAGW